MFFRVLSEVVLVCLNNEIKVLNQVRILRVERVKRRQLLSDQVHDSSNQRSVSIFGFKCANLRVSSYFDDDLEDFIEIMTGPELSLSIKDFPFALPIFVLEILELVLEYEVFEKVTLDIHVHIRKSHKQLCLEVLCQLHSTYLDLS
jgi:hypothetical protein